MKNLLNLIFLPIDIMLFIVKFIILNPHINQAIKIEHKNKSILNKIKIYLNYMGNPNLLNKSYPLENGDISCFYFNIILFSINILFILIII